MSGVGKRTAVVTRDLSTRVEFLEEGQRTIVSALTEMRDAMKTERREISDAFEGLRKDLNTRARPFPFKEVAGSVLTTIAIIGAGISVLNWWFDARTALIHDHVAALERTISPGEIAVLSYRIKELEAQMAPKSSVASQ